MSELHAILNRLSPEDALMILRALAREDEQMAARIAEIALAYLSNIRWDEVAFALYEELEFLEVEEVWDRAGSTRAGYVEPHEAAEEMMREVVEPYLEELKKFGALSMNVEANQMCQGLLLGLYRFTHESTSAFKDWASDAPSAFVWEVKEAWRMSEPGPSDIAVLKAFMKDELSGWKAYLLPL